MDENFRPENEDMRREPVPEVTQLLVDLGNGDGQALGKLMPIVYRELYSLARHYMAQERRGHTLQATALVNEAYVRLINWKSVEWRNRAMFYGVAAQMMRHVLTDYANSRNCIKRPGPYSHQPIDDEEIPSKFVGEDLIALNEALYRLAEKHPRAARVVELRHFGGLSVEETSVVLEVSPETVHRDWVFAQTWLRRELAAGNRDVTRKN
jgi:RNA polymerase sigma factor (TIGR02999 family)